MIILCSPDQARDAHCKPRGGDLPGSRKRASEASSPKKECKRASEPKMRRNKQPRILTKSLLIHALQGDVAVYETGNHTITQRFCISRTPLTASTTGSDEHIITSAELPNRDSRRLQQENRCGSLELRSKATIRVGAFLVLNVSS